MAEATTGMTVIGPDTHIKGELTFDTTARILEVVSKMKYEDFLQQRLFDSSDAAEGLAAYINKTVPRFKGV